MLDLLLQNQSGGLQILGIEKSRKISNVTTTGELNGKIEVCVSAKGNCVTISVPLIVINQELAFTFQKTGTEILERHGLRIL